MSPEYIAAGKPPRRRILLFGLLAVVFLAGGLVGGVIGANVGDDDAGPAQTTATTTVTMGATTTERATTTTRATTAGARATTTTAATPTTTIPPPTTTLPPTTLPPTTLPPPPRLYDGQGDAIIAVELPGQAAVAAIDYQGGSNFVVASLDANLERVNLLVNTIGAYTGTVPIDFRQGETTASLQIESSGPWHIELKPLSALRTFDIDTTGRGDDVVWYTGTSKPAAFTHTGQSNFAVTTYDPTGGDIDLLINEIGAYAGTVALRGPSLVEITADGDWTITVA